MAGKRCFDLRRGTQRLVLKDNDRAHGHDHFHAEQTVYNPTPYVLLPPSRIRQKTMTSDTPDDTNVLVTRNGQISPGCPTANAIPDGYSESQQFWSLPPILPLRPHFSPVMIPTVITPTPIQGQTEDLLPRSFILFQLDEQKLVRRPSDPEGSESLGRCLASPAKRYVGLVVGPFRGNGDSDAKEWVISFVSKSLPPSPGPSSEPDSFAIPIAPTERENINGRPPLNPRPFPWAGCYQYTVLGTRVVPTNIYPSTIKYGLSEEDFRVFETFYIDDNAKMDHQSRNMPTISDEKETSLFDRMKIPDTPLPVKVWYELRAGKECRDPREFVGELALIGAKEFSR